MDVKYLHNFGPQIGFNIYKLLEITESSQGQNTPLEVVINTYQKSTCALLKRYCPSGFKADAYRAHLISVNTENAGNGLIS